MTRRATPLLIVFVDLTRFWAQSQLVEDTELADTMDAFYGRVTAAVRGAGGTVVKFIGDAALMVFPEDAAAAGVRMLIELKPAIDELMAAKGWECRLNAKAHFGSAIAGQFGPAGDTRFDVIGRAVNVAAMLRLSALTLSADAYGVLPLELKAKFKEHETPGTFVLQ